LSQLAICGEAGSETILQRVFLKHHENLLEISALFSNDYGVGFGNSNGCHRGVAFTST
jgi:hypothetical protein